MGASPSRQETKPSDSSRAGGAVASSAASGTGSNSNQAQSKRPPPPHKFHEIVAQELTGGGGGATAAELEEQVYRTGVYLAGKTKKYWVHEKTRSNCFMLFARALTIIWSDDPRYWMWHPVKESGNSNSEEIEAASLLNVCWLEVHGKLELSHLTPGVNYDVVFQVMLKEPAYGWSVPVNLQLKFPDGTVQERKERLQEKPREQWLELKVGEVKAQPGHRGELDISLFEIEGGHWKKGLLIKGIKIASGTGSNSHQAQPKRPPPPHKFHEIVAQELTGGGAATAAELEDQVYRTGVYLAGKTKKYWVHDETRTNCFMLFARALTIIWSDDPRYWMWHPVKETSNSNSEEIEAASLLNVCWLEVHGKLELSHLTPGVNYDVVFQVMLKEPAYGWSVPVKLQLKFPDGTVQERKERLQEKPREQWLELKAGEVKAQPGLRGELDVSLFEIEGGHWKKGLLIKGIKIAPKE